MEGLDSNDEQQSQEAYGDETGLAMNSMKKARQGHRKMDEMLDHDVQLEKGMKSLKVHRAITGSVRIKDAGFEGSLERSSMKQKVSTNSEKGNRSRPIFTAEPTGSLKLETDLGLKCDEQLGCFTCHKCGQFISWDDNVYMYMDCAFCSTKCRGAPWDFDRAKRK
ncbi:hypothetical protein HS088_TW16G00182 [Tripterygium wilfordii]|uniref:FLZ-type domain-containing protein n=2 Tax=Tripterygium wilfordii TaxID=458696 RepID=A0A7J7CI56_TRIWF|nr:uncharacterized protein LOC119980449 isoform X2 [Tripterygium wilfordii]XP_038679075.1 uncharacterized protein LOC119980449 isoform X2 [Tripterygium wilfordii]KAF5733742.1 hypothetical protein HS088_TW16G00182 [Tripterygium wilfordii]